MKRLKARHKMQQLSKHGIRINPISLKACYGKVRYQTYNEAKKKAGLLLCHPYKCKFCKYYHFGHKRINT